MRLLLIILMAMLSLPFVNGQTREEIREFFEEGEYFFSRGDYQEAAYYYRKVIDKYPDNPNYNFKLGECYLNIPGNEILAIPYFEKAAEKIVAKNKYRRKDIEETNAPLHALFYLGNVYRMNNQLDDALKVYVTFVNSPYYIGNYNETIVDNEIKACERAKIIKDSPIDITEQVLDSVVKTTGSELNPVVSADGNFIVFTRRLKFYDAILFCEKQDQSWSPPMNLNPLIGSDGDLYPTCLSPDGTALYLVKKNAQNNDIYVAYRTGSAWSKAEKLNKYINTKADEQSAWISSDGQTLWFVSSRRGGYGGTDIYFSRLDKNKNWGKAHNPGKTINTALDEESPCLTGRDNILFFSSKGHDSMGGFDIFYSEIQAGNWSKPVNLGFPVNNTSDNTGYIALNEGKTGYLSKINPADRSTAEDIFRIAIRSNLPAKK